MNIIESDKEKLKLYLSDPVKYRDELELFNRKYGTFIAKGLRRETIKIEDWCDMDFSSMTFTITRIEQEKRVDTVTKIWFVPNDGEDYNKGLKITSFNVEFVGGINKITKELIREQMLSVYNKFKESEKKFDILKVGDII